MNDFFCLAQGTNQHVAKLSRVCVVPSTDVLLKQREKPVDAKFQAGHCRRDDPEDDQSQPNQGQVPGPIRFVVMNQSHDFLPADSTIRP
ncbi:MAG TPA: hypothetical protein VHZ29_16970 [Rhizomicrobium sp.]|jgi:hypothetical protein|nr:hypothetical protein [Rhizomicrobium sp.]